MSSPFDGGDGSSGSSWQREGWPAFRHALPERFETGISVPSGSIDAGTGCKRNLYVSLACAKVAWCRPSRSTISSRSGTTGLSLSPRRSKAAVSCATLRPMTGGIRPSLGSSAWTDSRSRARALMSWSIARCRRRAINGMLIKNPVAIAFEGRRSIDVQCRFRDELTKRRRSACQDRIGIRASPGSCLLC